VDNDPQALTASQDNAARNNIEPGKLPVALPPDVDLTAWANQAQLVIANILAGPLLELSDTLLQFLRPRGTLLLSGLLHSQAPALCQHYADRLILEVAGEKDDWVCLRGTLPQQ
jgi:ribosomal protein L11 methyltransferase